MPWIAACLATQCVVSCASPSNRQGAAPGLAELARALGPYRFVEGRVPGGFAYARLQAGTIRPEPDALAIAARLIKDGGTGSANEPATSAAIATAHLLIGDVDAAIGLLETVMPITPTPGVLTVLSAAYLERARLRDDAEAAARAMDAAERAIRLDSNAIEARFNRALALGRLGLAADAAQAWTDYAQRDRDSGWLSEARQQQHHPPGAGVEWEAVKKAMLEGGVVSDVDVTAVLRRFADRCRQLVENDLLRQWAEAVGDGRGERAEGALRRAARLATGLQSIRGDRTLLDAVERIKTESRSGRAEQIARGVLASIRARAAIDHGDELKSRQDLQIARTSFNRAHGTSDLLEFYGLFAGYYRYEYDTIVPRLRQLAIESRARGHLYVAGRCYFVLAAIASRQARPTEVERLYLEAADLFTLVGETGYLASIHAISSNRHREQGDDRGAWQALTRAFAVLPEVSDFRHQFAVFRAGQSAAVDANLPGLAAFMAERVVSIADRWKNPTVLITALMDDARQSRLTGDTEHATESIQRAFHALADVADPNTRELSAAVVSRGEAAVLLPSRPCDAVALQTSAITTLRHRADNQLPMALLERGRANRACGRVDDAERDYRDGIATFESKRLEQRNEQLRISRLDEVWDLYGELIRLLAIDRTDAIAALLVAEQSRGRVLSDELGNRRRFSGRIALEHWRAGLPPGLTVLSYTVLANDVLVWSVSRTAVTLARVGTGRADLTRTIAEWRRLVLDGGDERAIGRRLFDLLVKPVETTIAQDGLVVLIADGPLNALPFGALWDGQRYFIERAAVWSAPSLEMMMWASLRLRASPLAHDWLVAVGDPAHSPIRFPTLSRLAFAAREATEVARLYAHREALVGTDAAKPRIIAALARADIVHLAAHAVANVAVPSDSFVVTADDGSDHDDLITSSDIGRLHRLPARLIVLSACETASGRIARGEGTQSIARAFMGAGIATVIANLWEVPDSRSYEFFVSLHREMAQGAAVADVLRRVQRQWLGGDNAELRQVRSWAGVVGLGATGPMRAAPASRETNSGPEHVR